MTALRHGDIVRVRNGSVRTVVSVECGYVQFGHGEQASVADVDILRRPMQPRDSLVDERGGSLEVVSVDKGGIEAFDPASRRTIHLSYGNTKFEGWTHASGVPVDSPHPALVARYWEDGGNVDRRSDLLNRCIEMAPDFDMSPRSAVFSIRGLPVHIAIDHQRGRRLEEIDAMLVEAAHAMLRRLS